MFGLPNAVQADVIAQRTEAKVDDYFDVTLHYGPMRACLRCSTLTAEPRARFAVHGSGGSFVKFGIDVQEAQLKSGMDPRDPNFGVDDRTGSFTATDGSRSVVPAERGRYLDYYGLLVAAAVLDGAPAPVDPVDSRNGLMLIDLARRSSDRGQRLAVPMPESAASWTEG